MCAPFFSFFFGAPNLLRRVLLFLLGKKNCLRGQKAIHRAQIDEQTHGWPRYCGRQGTSGMHPRGFPLFNFHLDGKTDTDTAACSDIIAHIGLDHRRWICYPRSEGKQAIIFLWVSTLQSWVIISQVGIENPKVLIVRKSDHARHKAAWKTSMTCRRFLG